MSRAWMLGGGLSLAVLALLPLADGGYHMELLTVILFWAALASAWNLFCGFSGYVDFGSVAYVGTGSYACALLMLRLGWPVLPAALGGGVVAAGLALALGAPTLRLRGAYFAIATLALAETLRQVALEWEGLTGGGMGLTTPGRLPELAYYYAYLVLAALGMGLAWYRRRSALGLALKALCHDEAAAQGAGINTLGVKLTAYAQAAFLMGVLGGLDATRLGYFTPHDAFNVQITIKMVIMTLLGGAGTVTGPWWGAVLLQMLEDWLGATVLDLYLVLVGAVIVLVVLFLPRGILRARRRRP